MAQARDQTHTTAENQSYSSDSVMHICLCMPICIIYDIYVYTHMFIFKILFSRSCRRGSVVNESD